MAKAQTRKKICHERNPSAGSQNIYCRCCKAALTILYGSPWNSISTENIFRLSGKKDIEGQTLKEEESRE